MDNQLFDSLEKLLSRQDELSAQINKLQQQIYVFKNSNEQNATGEENPIDELNAGLEALLKNEDDLSYEINKLRFEINKLTKSYRNTNFDLKGQDKEPVAILNEIKITEGQPIYEEQADLVTSENSYSYKSDIEKFIGENLINKIGIIITVLGVAIGAKYSIENGWISPLTRIILGYLAGLGLLITGIKLKKDYENYSAVLVSGAMAVMYFITFASYSFYDLMPQSVTFALMVLFTAFTVIAAINYDKQVIAHIGMVGAYAVPFFLSDGSGRAIVLLIYVSIINIGILFLAFKKYWKPLYYTSFVITWLIFLVWYSSYYNVNTYFGLSLSILTINFLTFYLIFLAYKLGRKEMFAEFDVALLLANSFIFFGFGYSTFNSHPTGSQLLGLFALCNALIHFAVSAIIYKQKLADKHLFFFLAGLVLVFITMAIPIQLNGNWVTLIWVGEAALLFWIGRSKNIPFYEKASYILMPIAFMSLFHDWLFKYSYNPYVSEPATPLFNVNFLSSALFIAAFVFINYFNNRNPRQKKLYRINGLNSIASFAIPATLIVVLYFTFRIEISNYWSQLYQTTSIEIDNAKLTYSDTLYNTDLLWFETVWLLNYSMLFLALLSYVNIEKIRSRTLGLINLVFNIVLIVSFIIQALPAFNGLSDSFIQNPSSEYFSHTSFNIAIRYISYVCTIPLLISIYNYLHKEFLELDFANLDVAFDALLYTFILWIASHELISWLDIMQYPGAMKLGISILWGIYALVLIVVGIWKRKKHLRMGAIGLFAGTLIKLFFYDISELNTIAKTIVFVSLGLLLLIISFLYNKYKFLIAGNDEN